MENEVDVQAEMASSFFDDSQGLAVDSGTEDQGESEDNASSESISKSVPAQKEEVGAKSKEAPADQTQQPTQKAKPEEGEKKPFDPDSIEAVVWKTDEKGNSTFDIDKALELAKPDTKIFNETLDPKERQAATADSAAVKDDRPEWQKMAEEDQKVETTYRNNLTLYKNMLLEGLNKGMSGETALQYADSKVDQMIGKEMARRRYESDAKMRTELKTQAQQERENGIREVTSKNILAQLDRELNGNLNKLLLGYEKDGKYTKGVGTDDVNMLFSLMVPEARSLKGEQLQKAYSDWWLKVTSNEGTARWLKDIALNRFMKTSYPNMLREQRKAGAAQEKNLSEGKSRSPGNVHNDNSSRVSKQDIDDIFGEPTWDMKK